MFLSFPSHLHVCFSLALLSQSTHVFVRWDDIMTSDILSYDVSSNLFKYKLTNIAYEVIAGLVTYLQ